MKTKSPSRSVNELRVRSVDCDRTLGSCDRMEMMNRVKDKVAIVTGGAQGIGRAACLLLAKEGAVAVVTDISEVNGKKLVEEIRSIGGMANEQNRCSPLC